MKISRIIQQIKSYCPSITTCAGALTVDLRTKVSPDGLSAFVVRLDDEVVEPVLVGNDYIQDVTERFAVLVFFTQKDGRGQGVAESIDEVRDALIKSLVRWKPAEQYDEIVYEGSAIQLFTKDRVVVSFEFSCATEIHTEDTFNQVAYRALDEFYEVDLDVDVIEDKTGKPDGQVEAHFNVLLNKE